MADAFHFRPINPQDDFSHVWARGDTPYNHIDYNPQDDYSPQAPAYNPTEPRTHSPIYRVRSPAYINPQAPAYDPQRSHSAETVRNTPIHNIPYQVTNDIHVVDLTHL